MTLHDPNPERTAAPGQRKDLDLGAFSDLVAMAFAFTKATRVVLFFMHVRHASPLAKLTVAAGFAWLAILIGITLSDYFSRGFLG